MVTGFWNVPNTLSLSRLPLTAVLCAFISLEWWLFALLVLVIASLTDWLDGWWARKFNQSSTIGRSLDPLTDKVLIGGAFIFLMPFTILCIQPWMVTVIIARELFITGLRGIVEAEGKKFGADWFGKLKTVLQMVVLHSALLLQTLRNNSSENVQMLESANMAYLLLLSGMLIATIGSGVQYTIKAVKLLASGAT